MRDTNAKVMGLALLLCAAVGCRDDGPEAAVRRVLDDGVAAIHARDVNRAARHLSPGYRDRLGRTAREVRQGAFFLLRRGPVYVLLRDTTVEVTGSTARVTTTAYAVQGQPEVRKLRDLVPREADRLELTLRFALEDGRWRVRAIDGDDLAIPEWDG
jgi:hypothetical protein